MRLSILEVLQRVQGDSIASQTYNMIALSVKSFVTEDAVSFILVCERTRGLGVQVDLKAENDVFNVPIAQQTDFNSPRHFDELYRNCFPNMFL